MPKLPTRETIKRATIADMKALGVHKPQYNRLVVIYADLVFLYNESMQDFEESGREYETETAAGGSKKSPIVATMESLRKDILAYSDRLGLNPKSLESITADKTGKSKLASVLGSLE